MPLAPVSRRAFLASAAGSTLALASPPDLFPHRCLSHDSLVASPDGSTVYHRFGGTIRVIDPLTGDILKTLDVTDQSFPPLLEPNPAGMALSPDGRILFVPCRNYAQVAGFETESLRLLARLPVDVGNARHPICFFNDGRAVVIILGSGAYATISLPDLTLRTPSQPDFAMRQAIPSTRNPDILFCIGQYGAKHSFLAFNLRTGAIERSATLPLSNQFRLWVDEARNTAFVSYFRSRAPLPGEGEIVAIGLDSFRVDPAVPIAGGARDFFVHPVSGKLYIIGESSGFFVEWDPKEPDSPRKVPLSPGQGPSTIILDPRNLDFAWVADEDMRTPLLERVHLASGQDVFKAKFGNARVLASAIVSSPASAFISGLMSPSMHRFNPDASEFAGSFPLPDNMGGLAQSWGWYDGKLVLTTSTTVFVLGPDTGAVQARFALSPSRRFGRLTFFRDRCAAVDSLAGRPPSLVLLDAASFRILAEAPAPQPPPTAALASPDGSKLYLSHGSANAAGSLTILDSSTLATIATIAVPEAGISSGGSNIHSVGSFDEAHRILYFGGFTCVYVIDMDRNTLLGIIDRHDAWREMGFTSPALPTVITPVLSPDRKRLYIFCGDAALAYIYDVAAGRTLPRIPRMPGGCRPYGHAYSSDGRFLYMLGDGDFVSRLDGDTLETSAIGPIPGPANIVDRSQVANAAARGWSTLTPGELIVITAPGAGPPVRTTANLEGAGFLPTELARTQVLINGAPAPLLTAYYDYIEAIVPFFISGLSSVTLQVVCRDLQANTLDLPVFEARPALFTRDRSGRGLALATNEDSSPNSPENPAPSSSVITLYSTGTGLTDPPGDTAALITDPPPRTRHPVSVTIAEKPAEILFSGGIPGQPAFLTQIWLRLPASLDPSPAAPVSITMLGQSSQPNVTLAVS